MLTEKEKDLIRIIPKRYINANSGKVDLINAVKGKSAYISGKAGSGKTTFVCSCIKNEIGDGDPIDQFGFKCVFVGHSDLMSRCQQLVKDPEGDALKLINQYALFPRLLVIDDLYSSKPTDYIIGMTDYLINKRYENELQTIVTSNYSIGDLMKKISQRVASRLVEMSGSNIYVFTSSDFRLKKKA